MFHLDHPIEGLTGAEYNPRQIEPDALDALVASIDTIGVAKNIIATQGGLIVAGHQRTKAMRKMGRDTTPAFVLPSISTKDEIRFNQLHNGTDMDSGDEDARVPAGGVSYEYEEVSHFDITGNMRSTNSVVRAEIARLISKYGLWGNAVASLDGEILSGASYALACKLLKKPCRIYRVPDELKEQTLDIFARRYGQFSYEHLPRMTWTQTYAQMMRCRDGKRDNKSPTYEGLVIPNLAKDERLLDFGCGQGDYVRKLKRQGYSVTGIEFYRRKGDKIDTGAVHRMCDELFKTLREDGLFDVVVCDYVLNSTDRQEAEVDVMNCLNAFCKMGGRVYFSGRRKEAIESNMNSTSTRDNTRYVEFMDDDNYSAIFRKGVWTYQKYHNREQVDALVRTYASTQEYALTKPHHTGWQVATVKDINLDNVEDSIRREFNLPWPDGSTVDRGDEAVAAFHAAKELI